ncbi:hypothetical protein COX04_01625 [Candidatus Woesebacteria bacterium CG22_combo_CG10-13_8_21_14_all_45_10]|uniref:ABC transporter substrate-binding protein n=2 Tax=Candidatus Woeseibacteriota TaxID=1752722 RepID=A0A2H0BHE4_9BACT|nr:MAG: hypothetical protein COX04_01625 [Candidatus Woesebacteria bacterium CG22_combo_CG10-13_8_21_14_all_45_10]
MAEQTPPIPSIYSSSSTVAETPVSPVSSVASVVTPKKPFLKYLVFIFLGLALIGGIIFFLVRRNSNKGSSGEITWWGLWEDEPTVAPLITEYQLKNPKVTIKYVKQSQQDYRERLTNALAKGTGPDIFTFHNSWVPMFKNDLNLMPATVMSASEFAQIFYPVAASDLIMGTGILGIPLEYDAITLFINDDLFASAGATPPATWDDLRKTAIILTQKDERGIILQSGVALGRTENVDHWPEILALMMLQNGVDLAKPAGRLAQDALTFFTLFSSTDGVWDATLPKSTAMFAGGKLAMYFGPSWRAFEIAQQNPSLKFSTFPLPQLPKASSGQKDVAYASYWAEGVWEKSKNKTVAWDFLKFISSQDSLAKLYANAAKQRTFGEPYPRVDMAGLLNSHPVLGSIVSKAPNARSWYLQSRTFDGPTGINSLINKYFEDAINAVNSGTAADKALETAAQGVAQVLRQYGVTK